MTSNFGIQGCPKRKQRKKTFTWQWRTAKENEETGSSLRELKLRD